MRYFILSVWLLWGSVAYAQRETDHWICGHQSGLTFSDQGSISFLGSRLRQMEGSAVISDRLTGQLLFYTDGMTVWNRNHQAMTNGSGLYGSSTSTQSALIVPAPEESSRYYLFTVKAYNDGTNGGLHHSIIDMSLNGALGDVVSGQKNLLLETRTTEKLTAIPHANGKDYWIVSHGWDSDEFLVFRLSKLGISQPNRIRTGTIHHASSRVKNSEAMGYLKASPDGTMLASAVFGVNRPFELYDFDSETGLISNYRSLGNFTNQYGVSFSPDNSKLYLAGLYKHDGTYQIDLSQENYPVTKLTLTETHQGKSVDISLAGALQLGKDGKLYSATSSHTNGGGLAVINKPNEKGKNCQVGFQAVNFQGKTLLLGLPNFIQSSFNERKEPQKKQLDGLVSLYPNPVVSNSLTIESLQADQSITGLVVYDIAGREVTSHLQPITSSFTLDTSTWKSGEIYLIILQSKGQQISKKIIKQ